MILFRNQGAIDLRALRTFGLTSKEGQDKIGRFGTGLKYATAVIARHGGTMAIATGGETYTVGTTKDTFREREVTQLTLNGEPLPYTTDLGRDWEPWMAFRELYANALDEGGDVSRTEAVQDACGDETVISVGLDAFEAIFFSMEEHFIGHHESPIWKSKGIEVYAGRSVFVFYRGVAVMKLKEPAAFRYNLLGYVDLTEDRTAKYDWQVRSRIAEATAQTDHDAVAKGAADFRHPFEATLDFSVCSASEAFLGACVALGANCNPTAMALVRAQLPADANGVTVFSQDAPGGEALMVALRQLRACGADLSKCKFVLAAGVNFYGHYEVRGDAVFLNESIFGRQDAMTLACLKGFDEVVGHDWMAKRLISMVTEAAE